MKRPSKRNRKQLALRLFAVVVAINAILLICFVPSVDESIKSTLPEGMIELKVTATLFTSFEPNKRVLLTQDEGHIIGPVVLLEQQESSLTVAIPAVLYRQHHLRLGQESWAALPFLDGMQSPHTKKNGINYEIAY